MSRAEEPTVDSQGEHWCCPEAAYLSTQVKALREFVAQVAVEHTGCEDGWYACPRSEDYFGDYEDRPIEERPCFCVARRAQAVLDAE